MAVYPWPARIPWRMPRGWDWRMEIRETSFCFLPRVPVSTCSITMSIAEKFLRRPFWHGKKIKTRLGPVCHHVVAGDLRGRDGVQLIGCDGAVEIRKPQLFFLQADHGRSAGPRAHVYRDEDRLSPLSEASRRIYGFIDGCCAADRGVLLFGNPEHTSMDTVSASFVPAF